MQYLTVVKRELDARGWSIYNYGISLLWGYSVSATSARWYNVIAMSDDSVHLTLHLTPLSICSHYLV